MVDLRQHGAALGNIVNEESVVEHGRAFGTILFAVEQGVDTHRQLGLHALGLDLADGVEFTDSAVGIGIQALYFGGVIANIFQGIDEHIGQNKNTSQSDGTLSLFKELSQPQSGLQEHTGAGAACQGGNHHDTDLGAVPFVKHLLDVRFQLTDGLIRHGVHKGQTGLGAHLRSAVFHAFLQQFGGFGHPVAHALIRIHFQIGVDGSVLAGADDRDANASIAQLFSVIFIGIQHRAADLAVIDADPLLLQVCSHIIYNAAAGTTQSQ